VDRNVVVDRSIWQSSFSQGVHIPGEIFWPAKWYKALETGDAQSGINLTHARHRFLSVR
jgi:hypothetical protein